MAGARVSRCFVAATADEEAPFPEPESPFFVDATVRELVTAPSRNTTLSWLKAPQSLTATANVESVICANSIALEDQNATGRDDADAMNEYIDTTLVPGAAPLGHRDANLLWFGITFLHNIEETNITKYTYSATASASWQLCLPDLQPGCPEEPLLAEKTQFYSSHTHLSTSLKHKKA